MEAQAFSLLTTRKILFVEVPGTRYQAEIESASRGRPIALRIDSETLENHTFNVGQEVVLAVPLAQHLWQFPTFVIEILPGGPGRMVVAWPEEARRSTGRRQPRVDMMLPLLVTVEAEAEAVAVFATYTLDVSGGGLCFIYPHPVEAGQVVSLRMNLPGGASDVRVRVAWTRFVGHHPEDPQFQVGVEFTDIASPVQRRLAALMSRLR